MQRNYNELLARLNSRMNPDGITINKSFSDELRSIPQNGIFQYIKKSMLGVDPEYTKKSIEAGNKVKEKLKSNLTNVDFDFQGSVMTNTHIKGNSDIDLLTVCEKFYTYDRNGISEKLSNPIERFALTDQQVQTLQQVLQGGGYASGLSDLRNLRIDSEEILTRYYNYVDISKSKSIKVSMTSPQRDVDVVIANWYKNVRYYLEKDKKLLGVKIFVKGEQSYQDKELKPDFPFLRISMINEKDNYSNGRLKKMIRFLKNVKFDSDNAEKIELSSFDINSICYNIDLPKYIDKNYLDLVSVLFEKLHNLSISEMQRNRLKSVDGREYIFVDEQGKEKVEKVQSLRYMVYELSEILKLLEKETYNQRLVG